jgi:cellulose synthase operon protein C
MVERGQNLDVALSLAQTARQKDPDSPDSADTLAWVYYHKGTYESARDLLEDAVKAAPDNAYVQLHLGMTYNKLNQRGDAEAHLKKAASLAPNSAISKTASDLLSQIG